MYSNVGLWTKFNNLGIPYNFFPQFFYSFHCAKLIFISHISDINECSYYKNLCGKHAQCVNKIGGYSCKCKRGFERKNGKCRKGTSRWFTTKHSLFHSRMTHFRHSMLLSSHLGLQDYGTSYTAKSDVVNDQVKPLQSHGQISLCFLTFFYI